MNWLTSVAQSLGVHPAAALIAKSAAILATGLLVLAMTTWARAAVRHLVVVASFGGIFVLPVVAGLVPARDVRLRMAPAAVDGQSRSDHADRGTGRLQSGIAALDSAALPVWGLGAGVLAVLLLVESMRLRRLRRTAIPWIEHHETIRSLAAMRGVTRPIDLLLHEDIATPMTFGWWRPVVLFPATARGWESEALRCALLHELEHIRRADWSTQLAGRVGCIVYWPNPFVWAAWRRLCFEAERACDDAVLTGAERTAYARLLVTLARSLSTTRSFASVTMARRSDLADRVSAILDESRPRGHSGVASRVTVVGATALLVWSVAPLRAVDVPAPPHRVAAGSPSRLSSAEQAAFGVRQQSGRQPDRSRAQVSSPAGVHFALPVAARAPRHDRPVALGPVQPALEVPVEASGDLSGDHDSSVARSSSSSTSSSSSSSSSSSDNFAGFASNGIGRVVSTSRAQQSTRPR
jgi:beta-lactamase regulating signal transducer with metallopeptidase domain